MLNNNKISLSDILREFDKGLLGKTAEELEAEEDAPAYGLQPETAPGPVPPADEDAVDSIDEEGDYEDEDEDELSEHDEECECDVCNMRDAVDELADRQDEAVDAARALRDMADDYIEQHDEAIAKEASLFGEIFAKTACRYMNKNAAGYEDYDMENLEGLVKQAVDEAYTYTLRKLASEEAFEAAAQAISDSAAAARTLVENMGDEADAEDPEVQAGQAAADAYQETMDRLTGGEGAEEEEAPIEDEQAAAAQNGYDQASQQLADAQAAEQIDQQAASQNAYDQAMNRIQDQQQAPQGY